MLTDIRHPVGLVGQKSAVRARCRLRVCNHGRLARFLLSAGSRFHDARLPLDNGAQQETKDCASSYQCARQRAWIELTRCSSAGYVAQRAKRGMTNKRGFTSSREMRTRRMEGSLG